MSIERGLLRRQAPSGRNVYKTAFLKSSLRTEAQGFEAFMDEVFQSMNALNLWATQKIIGA